MRGLTEIQLANRCALAVIVDKQPERRAIGPRNIRAMSGIFFAWCWEDKSRYARYLDSQMPGPVFVDDDGTIRNVKK